MERGSTISDSLRSPEPTASNPEELNPQDDAAALQLIVQMRIYDVLMALLHEQNPDKANELLEIHSTGALVGTAPFFIGEFITDKLNIRP